MGDTLQPSCADQARIGECGTARMTFAQLTIERSPQQRFPRPGLEGIPNGRDVRRFNTLTRSTVVGLPEQEAGYALRVSHFLLHLSPEQLYQKSLERCERAVRFGEITPAQVQEEVKGEVRYHSEIPLRNRDGTCTWFEYRFDGWVSQEEFEQLHAQAVKAHLHPSLENEHPGIEGSENAWYEMSMRSRRISCLACKINSSMEPYPEGRALARALLVMDEAEVDAFVRRALGLELLRSTKPNSPALHAPQNSEILKLLSGPARPAFLKILQAELSDDQETKGTVEEFGLKLWSAHSEANGIGNCEVSYGYGQLHGLLQLLNRHGDFDLLREGGTVLSGGNDVSQEQARALLDEIDRAMTLLEQLQVPAIEILGSAHDSRSSRIEKDTPRRDGRTMLKRIPQTDTCVYGNQFGGYGIELETGQSYVTVWRCPDLLSNISTAERRAMRDQGPGSLGPIVARIREQGDRFEVISIRKDNQTFRATLRDGRQVELPPVDHPSGRRETIFDAFSDVVPLNVIQEIRFSTAEATEGFGPLLTELRRVVAAAVTHGFSLYIR